MGRSQETFNKKEVRNKKEKKRKDKEKARLAKKENPKLSGLDNMMAYVDENGMISDTPPDPAKKRTVKLEDIEIGTPNRDNEPELDPVRKGTVTFFNDSKGYGFIKDSETKEGIFVHANNLLEDITEGNLVVFEVERGLKGLTAVKVKIHKEEPKSVEPKVEEPKSEEPKSEAPENEAPENEAPENEAPENEAPENKAPEND